MRTPVLLAVLVLLPAVTAPFAASLPVPGQGDAGTGTDAPDQRPATGQRLTPGTYSGTLTPGVDAADYFLVAPPPNAVVRVVVHAQGERVVAELFDPAGRERDYDLDLDRSGRNLVLASIAQPEGLWTLGVRYPDLEVPRPSVLEYTLVILFETHAHVGAVEVPWTMAHAVRVGPSGSWARVEAVFSFPGPLNASEAYPLGTHVDLRVGEKTIKRITSLAGWVADGRPSMWAHNLPVEAEHTTPPLLSGRIGDLNFVLQESDGGVFVRGGLIGGASIPPGTHAAWDLYGSRLSRHRAPLFIVAVPAILSSDRARARKAGNVAPGSRSRGSR